VDYAQTVEEVYINFTWTLMTWLGSLEPISCPRLSDSTLRLPSWVAEFSQQYKWGYRYRFGDRADSLADFSAEMRQPGKLTVRARIIDTVDVCAAALERRVCQETFEEETLEEYAYKTIADWKSLANEYAHIFNTDPPQLNLSFWHAVMQGETEWRPEALHISPLPAGFSTWEFDKLDGSSIATLEGWFQTGQPLDPAKCCLPIDILRWGAIFFITIEGFMGLAQVPGTIMAGDVLAVLAGLSTPILLRRANDDESSNVFRVVATCHCYGKGSEPGGTAE
jgi:hypothetical protein